MRARRLPRFPNYESGHEIEVAPGDTNAETFRSRYLSRHRPCVLRGVAREWPAVQLWNAAYLNATCPDGTLGGVQNGHVADTPFAEFDRAERTRRSKKVVKLSEFLARVTAPDCQYLQAYSIPLTGGFTALKNDLGTVPVIDLIQNPPRLYRQRMFLSRAGYTDWHFHRADETFTVQIAGTKEVLLLPPDRDTWNAIWPATKNGVYKADPTSGQFARLVPYRAVLAPGDVLYLPQYWWHAAEATTDELIVTVAQVFRTPLYWTGELRLPGAQRAFFMNLQYLAKALLNGRGREAVGLVHALSSMVLGAPWALVRNQHLDFPLVEPP